MIRKIVACGVLASIASFASGADVKAVETLDLDRYMGSWHEIAAIPQFFQRKCVRDTRATYAAAESSLIRVDNVCTREDGGRDRVEGRARRVDTSSQSKLQVSFIEVFGEYRFWISGDYWVVALDPSYRWAVVGHPYRRYGWVLAREPRLSPATLAEIIGRIKLQGYDACEFVVTPQTGGLSVRRPLCEALP
ncbi:MAG TPA: lipocalin family protein [Zoogloea sp.]|nr:lipocalin family protein [Zoogloea sp.]